MSDISRKAWYVVNHEKLVSVLVKGPFKTRARAEAAKRPDEESVIYEEVIRGEEALDEGWKFAQTTSR